VHPARICEGFEWSLHLGNLPALSARARSSLTLDFVLQTLRRIADHRAAVTLLGRFAPHRCDNHRINLYVQTWTSHQSGWQFPKRLLLACILLCVALTSPHPAAAWGDEGHKIIALIAEHHLDPAVRAKVATLLAADTDTLTDHDIASEATWADKYRDSDRQTTKIRYEATWRWHFVDIELTQADLAPACSERRRHWSKMVE
jgi:S1/P1 Nuclease